MAVDNLAGRSSASETESDAQCRTTHVLAALGSMLALTGGTPTTILVFAGGLSPPGQKIIDDTGRRALLRPLPPPQPRTTPAPVRTEDWENTAITFASNSTRTFTCFT